jgi:hypothetical protein
VVSGSSIQSGNPEVKSAGRWGEVVPKSANKFLVSGTILILPPMFQSAFCILHSAF